MLKEIKKVRQVSGEPERLWFNSSEMDLIIWQEDNSYIGFQLCYDKSSQEKALSWKPSTGLVYEKVDDGESRDGHYKATPILLKNGSYDLKKARSEFISRSAELTNEIRDFVLKNLNVS